jgi:hypothetical protein
MSEKQKANPSIAQIKHRHKFVTIGTVASIHSRLHQLIEDKMIPSGELKLSLIAAHNFMHKAQVEVRKIDIIVKGETK